jgi:oligopeptide/dipeptide ABC transporter ATP-binding protein
MLRVENLVKRFPVRGSDAVVSAVNKVTFEVGRGETLGLVGESGSGKTTVGMCLLRLVEPTAGRIVFDGLDLTNLSSREFRRLRPRIQMVFQEPFLSLNPRRSVRATIEEPLKLAGRMTEKERRSRVGEVLDMVRLTPEHLSRYPHQLTAGEQQRVGIARAIATDPDFVVLDEPTSLLDPSIRAEIVDLLIEIQRRSEISYLFISHDLTTVRYISDSVAVMYLGQIVETAETEKLFERPLHPYTRALLSAVLIPDPAASEAPLPLEGEIPSPINLPSGCYLASRCPYALPSCSDGIPPLEEIEQGHRAACFRAAELFADKSGVSPATDVSVRGQ